jgi:membrane associated rhomboid family serine protease
MPERPSLSSAGRPSRREPLLNVPPAVATLIVGMLFLHFVSSLFGEQVTVGALRQFAFVPARLTVYLWPGALAPLIAQANTSADALDKLHLMRFFEVGVSLKPWTLVTYALLHGSWTHIGLNGIWMLAFGPPVERRLGALRLTLFFALSAAVGALAQWSVDPMEASPLIGASASVSALMGAAARFAFTPGALGVDRIDPLPTLRELFRDPRSLFFVGLWLLTNLLFGLGAQDLGLSDAPVAWVAHFGGFAFGFLALPLMERALPTAPVRRLS